MRTLTLADGNIDYRLHPAESEAMGGPPLVFLHEGIGSIELWRAFPAAVRKTTGGRATVVYSRFGHGWSSLLARPRDPDYMHREALDVLPEILRRLAIEAPVLIGHSDGASIAIIHTGAGHTVAGLVLLAPHVFVEERSLEGIRAARRSFLETDMPARMARYHQHPDATFLAWNDIWLSPQFRDWSIEEYLPGIRCPILLIQGDADEYGTLAQLDAIERGVSSRVTRLVLEGAGHTPHVDRRDETLRAIAEFVTRIVSRRPATAEPRRGADGTPPSSTNRPPRLSP